MDNPVKKTLEVEGHEMTIIALGAGCEVGRSCVVVTYRGRSVMFDCGIHPGHSGIGALPIFDAVDVSSIDLCLITHFHLDHCGALPYFVSKTSFKGTVLMTEPTRAIARLLWADYAAMASRAASAASVNSGANTQDTEYETSDGSTILFDSADVDQTMAISASIDFRQTLVFKDTGIRVSCYAAGHVLGACMFCVDIAGVRVMYTGDFSREVDRHVPVAEIPDGQVHVLICESTYGIRVHEPRKQREQRFLDSTLRILQKGGKCLMPVFALGRAQELLLILEEYWNKHPEVQHIPIWYCSPMSYRSMPVFETFISVCGDYVKKIADSGGNAFKFNYVRNARRLEDMQQDIYKEGLPCIVMAAPGMMQSGASRSLFELWCRDPRNGVILTGYSVRGTLADDLKCNPHSLQLQRDAPPTHIASSFEMISFSAHTDFWQTFEFIEKLQPQIIVLVHGERGEITRLCDKLKELRPLIAVFAPEILQRVTLKFPFRPQVLASGGLAKRLAAPPSLANDDKSNTTSTFEAFMTMNTPLDTTPVLYDPTEVPHDIPTTLLIQSIKADYPYESLKPLLDRVGSTFETMDLNRDGHSFITEGRVRADLLTAPPHYPTTHQIRLTWHSDPMADVVGEAISCLAIDAIAEGGKTQQHMEPVSEGLLRTILIKALETYFEEVSVKCGAISKNHIESTNKKDDVSVIPTECTVAVFSATEQTLSHVHVVFQDREVTGKNPQAVNAVRQVLRRVEHALLPLPSLNLLRST